MVCLWSAVARSLGPDGLGKIQLAYLLTVVVSLLTSVGLPISNSYLLGQRLFPIAEVLGENLLASILGSAIAVCVMIAAQGTLRRIVPVAPELLLVTLAWIPLQTLVSNVSSILLAERRFGEQSLINVFQGTLSLGFVLIALKFMAGGVRGVAVALVLSTFAGFIYLLVLLRAELAAISVPSAALVGESLALGLKGYFGTLLQLFTYRFDVFVVGRFSGTTALGYYAIAYSVTECVWQIPQAIATVLMPTTASSGVQEANQRTSRICRVSVAFTVVGGVLFALVSTWLVPFLFGQAYKRSVLLIWVLLPGTLAFVLPKVIAADLCGRGRAEYASYASFGGLLATIVLDLLLIPRFGALAAAAISSVVYIAQAIYFVACFCVLSGVPPEQVIVQTWSDVRALASSSRLAVRKYLLSPGIACSHLGAKTSILTRE